MSKALIEVTNLKKYFKVSKGFLHAVDDVSFTIEEGKTIGVVGESGCGKSTLGRTILRLLEPTAGEIKFDGQVITKLKESKMREMREKMQIIFQDPYSSLDPRMSIGELIGESIRFSSKSAEREQRVKKAMEQSGLAQRLYHSYPHELDGGRRQRVGIARALIMKPTFIVCDEPVSALDVSIQAQILNLLQDLQDELKLTYMFITHDLSIVKHISSTIMVMYMGRVVEEAPADELFENPVHPYTKALLSAILVPDYSLRNTKIETLKGEVTSPINPKPLCRFAARCVECCDKCREADPELKEISKEHFVACFNR